MGLSLPKSLPVGRTTQAIGKENDGRIWGVEMSARRTDLKSGGDCVRIASHQVDHLTYASCKIITGLNYQNWQMPPPPPPPTPQTLSAKPVSFLHASPKMIWSLQCQPDVLTPQMIDPIPIDGSPGSGHQQIAWFLGKHARSTSRSEAVSMSTNVIANFLNTYWASTSDPLRPFRIGGLESSKAAPVRKSLSL